jgi:hypothetical protein
MMTVRVNGGGEVHLRKPNAESSGAASDSKGGRKRTFPEGKHAYRKSLIANL